MSNDWSNGLCSCFGDITTCKWFCCKFFVCFCCWLFIPPSLVQKITACFLFWKSLTLSAFFLTGIITYFVPCYTFGKNAEQLGESCVTYGLSQLVPILDIWCRTQVRGKIREQKGIEGSCIKDLLMHLFCGLCALIQEARVSSGPCCGICANVYCDSRRLSKYKSMFCLSSLSLSLFNYRNCKGPRQRAWFANRPPNTKQ